MQSYPEEMIGKTQRRTAQDFTRDEESRQRCKKLLQQLAELTDVATSAAEASSNKDVRCVSKLYHITVLKRLF